MNKTHLVKVPMENTLNLNEFFVEGENQELSHVLLHIIQPSTPEEEKEKGYFFAACEINNGDKEDVFNLQALMDRIENEYYEITAAPGKDALEVILEKINRENFEMSGADTELHCLVGILRDKEIIFSFCGQPEALLFFKNKYGQFQKMDLVAANEEEGETDKLFSQIIQGKISPGDYFFGGTRHIVGCFNHDRLQKIITGRDTKQSAEHFEKVLGGLRGGYSYGGLIIHFSPAFEALGAERTRVPEKETLFSTEQQTARTLSPSLLDNLNTKVKTIVVKNDEIQSERDKDIRTSSSAHAQSASVQSKHSPVSNKTAPVIALIVKKIWQGAKYAWYGIYWVFFMLAKLVVNIGRYFIMLVIVATNFKNRRRAILESWSENRRRFVRQLKELPLITKILAFASIIFAIIFFSSVIYLQTEKSRAETDRLYREDMQLIKNKTDAAESAIIYGDEAGAKNQADEAGKLAAAFVCRPADKPTCDDVKSRLSALALKLRKMDVTALSVIVDWGSLGLSGTDKMVKIENKLIGFSAGTSTVAVYDLMTKENKIIRPTESVVTGFIAGTVPKENDYALLLASDKKSLYFFDPKTNELRKADISYSVANPDIRALTIYSRRLYSLDASTNQIYRHDSIKNGFGQGKDWLKNTNLNIRDGADMAIDGDLYVLKTTGEVLKFNQGAEQPVNLETIDPALDSGNEIWTYLDVNNLYILDAKNKRLIIFDKTGKFIRQITADELTGPTAFAVDEAKGESYVLDSDKVYQINLK
jgi:hypothetical protein